LSHNFPVIVNWHNRFLTLIAQYVLLDGGVDVIPRVAAVHICDCQCSGSVAHDLHSGGARCLEYLVVEDIQAKVVLAAHCQGGGWDAQVGLILRRLQDTALGTRSQGVAIPLVVEGSPSIDHCHLQEHGLRSLHVNHGGIGNRARRLLSDGIHYDGITESADSDLVGVGDKVVPDLIAQATGDLIGLQSTDLQRLD
jgi:hypothetical protein